MKLIITGDLVISQSYDVSNKIDQDITDLFFHSDCNIVNLEAPVTDSKSKILKTGPHLKSDKQSTLNIMKKLNVHIAALANNHIKDYDEEGVLDTINFCENNGIKTIGAGANIKEASETTVLNTLEGKIAIINIAENEWSSADEDAAGANGMDLIKDYNSIKKAKENYDFVIVIVHGGLEYYNLPSPKVQQRYRFYVDSGASLVVGHHTHCISGFEYYKDVPIYYSLGNFLFTKESKFEEWYTGIVLEVNIEDTELTVKTHPIRQSKTFSLSLLEGSDKKSVLTQIERYSEIIINEEQLSEEWDNVIHSKIQRYISYWSPKSFIKSKYLLGVLSRLNIKLINKSGLALYLNLMRCETHSDISNQVIEKYLRQ